jgi:hypothetical protein
LPLRLIEEVLLFGGVGALLGAVTGLCVVPWRSVAVAGVGSVGIWGVWWEVADVVGMFFGLLNVVAATVTAAGISAVRAR